MMRKSGCHSVLGLELPYEVLGEGAPLLIIHGFAGEREALLKSFTPLAEQYQLIILDMSGHSVNGSFNHLKATVDIKGLLDKLNVSRMKAIGFSSGGNILLHLAHQHQILMDAMVLVSTAIDFSEESRYIMNHFSIDARQKESDLMMQGVHGGGDESLNAIWQQAEKSEGHEDDIDLTLNDLAATETRTLIVYGDEDPLYPVESAVDLYRAIPEANLWVIPKAGHVPFDESNMETFIKASRSFFAQS